MPGGRREKKKGGERGGKTNGKANGEAGVGISGGD